MSQEKTAGVQRFRKQEVPDESSERVMCVGRKSQNNLLAFGASEWM